MKPAQFGYLRPDTLAEAIGLLKDRPHDARVIAGGQSLGPMLNLRLAQPKHIIDISRLGELCDSSMSDDTLAIGACITHAQIEDGKITDVTRGLLAQVAKGIAYRAVRNRGTVGGSLAHADPAADWLTTMIALDASLELAGANGRSQVKVANFVTGALETTIEAAQVLTCVLVHRLSTSARWGYAKYARNRVILPSRWQSPSSTRSAAYRASCWDAAANRPRSCTRRRRCWPASQQSLWPKSWLRQSRRT
jgi:carbon-monoxide dehydrogenase medium subunit